MGALLLGIVLIDGYQFQRNHSVHRLKFVRRSGYHIYFSAGFSGFKLLVAATLIWTCVDYYDVPSKFIIHINNFSSVTFLKDQDQWVNLKITSVILLMLAISTICTWSVGKYYEYFKQLFFRELLTVVNDLERLIILSTINAELIRIELECGKVYVGIPDSPDLENGELTHLTIFPFLSGFRDEKKNIIFTNNYEKHYDSLVNNSNKGVDGYDIMNEYRIVIPMETVIVASKFNLDAYAEIHNSPV